MIDLSELNFFQRVFAYMRLPHSYHLNMFTTFILMLISGAFIYRSTVWGIMGEVWMGLIEFFIGLMIAIFAGIPFSTFMRKYSEYISLGFHNPSDLEIKHK